MYFLEELQPRIFCVTFFEKYDLAMAFMRWGFTGVDEDTLYEDFGIDSSFASSFQDIHKVLTYSNKKKHLTYTSDWSGFALDSNSIEDIFLEGIKDFNEWDRIIISLYGVCKIQYPNDKFYLLGTTRSVNEEIGKSFSAANSDVLIARHEIAHAFFDLNKSYKEEMTALFDKVPENKLDMFLQVLKGWGYEDGMLIDETQAYLCCPLSHDKELRLLNDYEDIECIQEPFITTFNKYFNKDFIRRLVFSYSGN
jgi:hypothetical protein